MAVIKSQGTEVYAVVGSEVTLLDCLTTIDLGSDSTNRIETTCLDERESKTYVSGLTDTAEASLGFNLDTANASHLKLITWAQSKKEEIMFYVGASDGTGAITVSGSGSGSTVTKPTTRSWWEFEGGLSTPVPRFEADSLIGYTVSLQRSSSVVFTPKTTP